MFIIILIAELFNPGGLNSSESKGPIRAFTVGLRARSQKIKKDQLLLGINRKYYFTTENAKSNIMLET